MGGEQAGGLVQIGGGAPVAPVEPAIVSSSASQARKKLYIHTFGCQMNVSDSEKLGLLLSDGYEQVSRAEDADLILVNTCSIRDKAEQKLYSLVGSYRPLKEKNPEALIGVGGCVAQQEGEKILRRAPLTDFVFGTHNLSQVPALVRAVREGKGSQVSVDYREDWEDLPLRGKGGRASAFVTISRGCNKNCTYCIVPTTRGKEVSRPLEEILTEVRYAAEAGVREVTLLGQTVNSYGLDLTPRYRFSALLKRVSEIEGIERIRFTSPHPQEIRSDFFDLLRDNEKVCRHVHMPLQSGSDRILKAMNRNYRMKRYFQIIEGLRAVCPEIALSTDLIVGFPGETEEDFQATLDAMREVRFDSSYSFAFSSRPGTAAEVLPGQIEEEVKKERLAKLQQLQDEHTQESLQQWNGRTTEVLLDGFMKSDAQRLQGRNSQNVLVHLDRPYHDIGPGMTVPVRIHRVSRYTLHGERIEG